MIKILLLLVSAWAVLCNPGPYLHPLYEPIVWSKGMTNENAPDYHFTYKECLDRRSSSTKVPYKGANCIVPSINEFDENDIKQLFLHMDSLQYYVYGGREKLGNPGPQPPASINSYTRPQYDKDLAEDAWRWARECTLGRDPCTLLNNTVGQNTITVWTHWNEQVGLQTLLYIWRDEVEHFNKKWVDKFNPDPETLQKIGNYSQLAWSKTKKFGCAKRIGTNGTMYSTTLVCNFWPQGNVIGQPVYPTDLNSEYV